MKKRVGNRVVISIIVPLYHGIKYIDRLHEMISLAAEKASSVANVEWVISNDDPNEKVENLRDDLLDIVVVNTDVNQGIQGARVTGLKKSKGEYVVFFDQDDVLNADYFVSQLEHIGDADAVVCDGLDNGYPMYPSGKRNSLEESITKEFNLSVASGFIPGQVMLKRDSIPDIWINKWLKFNCCDDYYLWLCMYAGKKVFVSNPNVLYEHTLSGNNQGNDSLVWYKSTREMLDVIHEQGLFDADEEILLERTANSALETILFNKNVVGKKCNIYRKMLSMYEKKISLKAFFDRKGYKEIAIYGAALGMNLLELMKRENLHVLCIIDRNSPYVTCDIPVVKRENIPILTDCIINTLIKDEKKTEDYIHSYYPEIDVISLTELLNDITENI